PCEQPSSACLAVLERQSGGRIVRSGLRRLKAVAVSAPTFARRANEQAVSPATVWPRGEHDIPPTFEAADRAACGEAARSSAENGDRAALPGRRDEVD